MCYNTEYVEMIKCLRHGKNHMIIMSTSVYNYLQFYFDLFLKILFDYNCFLFNRCNSLTVASKPPKITCLILMPYQTIN